LLLLLLLLLQCAEDPNMRDLIRQYGGNITLVNTVSDPEVNPEVLLAATGAIWKLSLSSTNAAAFQKLGIIPVLVRLLNDQPEKVRMISGDTQHHSTRATCCNNFSKHFPVIHRIQRRVVDFANDQG